MSIIASDIGSRQQDGPGTRLGRVVDAETQARMDYISACVSRYNAKSTARLVATCDDTDVAAATEPSAAIPADPTPLDVVTSMVSEFSRRMDEMFNNAVDRVLARVRAAARAAAARAAARFRDLAAASHGIATLCARRATAHGGRASQARGDDDPAPADSEMTRFAGTSYWNLAGPTARAVGPVFCVSRTPDSRSVCQ